MVMLARASLAALFGFLLLVGFSGATQAQVLGTLQGQFWLVPNSGLNATLPVPEATPDATFVTRHVSFEMTAPAPTCTACNNVNNTVESFLGSKNPDAVTPVMDLAFSGSYNSAVGAVVDGATPVVNSTAGSCGTYGAYMTLAGTVRLTNGEYIYIEHGNGISLLIDGGRISSFSDGNSSVVLQAFNFTGKTGVHNIELIYVNACGAGFLSFSPEM
jgi:hypothetical protein